MVGDRLGPMGNGRATVLGSLRRYALAILGAAALVFIGLTIIDARTQPSYLAEASVIVREPVGGSGFDVERYIADQVNIISSTQVATGASELLADEGFDIDYVALIDGQVVDNDSFSNRITVAYESATPELAQAAVDALFDSYEAVVASAEADRAAVFDSSFKALIEELDERLADEELGAIERSSLIAQRTDLELRIVELQASTRLNASPFALRQHDILVEEVRAFPIPLRIAFAVLAGGLVVALGYARDRRRFGHPSPEAQGVGSTSGVHARLARSAGYPAGRFTRPSTVLVASPIDSDLVPRVVHELRAGLAEAAVGNAPPRSIEVVGLDEVDFWDEGIEACQLADAVVLVAPQSVDLAKMRPYENLLARNQVDVVGVVQPGRLDSVVAAVASSDVGTR